METEREGAVDYLKRLLLFIHLASIDNRVLGYRNLSVSGTTVHFWEAVTQQFP